MKSFFINNYYILIIWAILSFSCVNERNNFSYSWEKENNKTWVGAQFWVNRLQDWHVTNGRVETRIMESNLPLRTLHLLTTQLSGKNEPLEIIIQTGLVHNAQKTNSDALTGLLIGAGGTDLDYRAASLIHNTPAPNAGVLIGITGDGQLHIKKNAALPSNTKLTSKIPEILKNCQLKVTVKPENENTCNITLTVFDETGRNKIDQLVISDISPSSLTGNIALVSHSGTGGDPANFWFSKISVSGKRLLINSEQEFGPIAFCMYTLSEGTLKMSAQMMPVGVEDPETVDLQILKGSEWEPVTTESFSYPDYTALFRIDNWDNSNDYQYRLVYNYLEEGIKKISNLRGIIKKEPLSKDTLKTVSIACVGHNISGIDEGGRLPGWTNWNYDVFSNMRKVWDNDNLFTTENIWFPHQKLTQNLTHLNPDIIFFLGDQVYEFRPTRGEYENGEITMLDYLYKWYLWGWSFKDVICNRPTVCMIDDHDVYQGNIWGDGGRKPPTGSDRWRQGGYTESPEFINMVQRTQTVHLPDPYDPTPVDQGIGVYYTSLDYGGVSFSILEDRKFKSYPDNDEKGPNLLGSRQLSFLDHWISIWNGETNFKVCMSQSLFACVNTRNGEIIKDFDTNGWPPEKRNKVLQKLRKAFAFMIGGDQHLATVVHHGTNEWDDAGYSVIAPAIGCVYPRFWQPNVPPVEPDPSGVDFLGKYLDAFGNKVNVKAVANPSITNIPPIAQNDLGVGYIVVDFIKSSQQIKIEHWPVSTDLSEDNPKQYDGWPITINMRDNYSRKSFGYLPKLVFDNIKRPYIKVVNEETGEMIYNLRINEDEFTPKVFRDGTYTAFVGTSSDNILAVYGGLRPSKEPKFNKSRIMVTIK